jgi:hypothetical protein
MLKGNLQINIIADLEIEAQMLCPYGIFANSFFANFLTAIIDQTNHKKTLKALLCNAFKVFLGLGFSAKRCNCSSGSLLAIVFNMCFY